jgi:hypothetical protein
MPLTNSPNHFLSSLSAQDRDLLQPHLKQLQLPQGSGGGGAARVAALTLVLVSKPAPILHIASFHYGFVQDGERRPTSSVPATPDILAVSWIGSPQSQRAAAAAVYAPDGSLLVHPNRGGDD